MAIEGYDPVAFFSVNKAVGGNSKYTLKHKGFLYHFSSEKNKKTFSESPIKYTPQYGGWCDYAMGSKREKVEIKPESFKINNGKLYLFYKNYFSDTLESWNENPQNLKQKADKKWAKIIKK